jgi:hypothetical protein
MKNWGTELSAGSRLECECERMGGGLTLGQPQLARNLGQWVTKLGPGRRGGQEGGVATRGGSPLLHCLSQTVLLFPFAAGGLLVLPSHARASSLAVALRWRRAGLVVASSRLLVSSLSRVVSCRVASHRIAVGTKKTPVIALYRSRLFL